MNVVPFVGRSNPALETLTGEMQAMVLVARNSSKRAVHYNNWANVADDFGDLDSWERWSKEAAQQRKRGWQYLDWARQRQAEITKLMERQNA